MEVTIGSNKIQVRGLLLCGVFDAPAKSDFMNIVQHNGFYSCPYCKEKGETCWTSEKGHNTVLPFKLDCETGHDELRTHDETLEFADQAQKHLLATGKEQPVFGVKGKCWPL